MPETLTAPPSAAPAAPAPSPSSAAPPSPASPPSTSSSDSTAAMESEFDRMEARYTPKASEPKEPDADPKAKTPDVSRGTKPATPPAKEPEAKKDDRQIEQGPKALREQLAKVNKERDDASAKIKSYESKIAEYEAKGKDTSALTEQLSREKQEKESLMAEIRMLKKEVSPDFKQKWDKPFEQAVGYAMKIVPELVVQGETNPETGEKVSQDRPATWSDFTQLYQMPINKAISMSKKMFGDASSLVEHHLVTLKQLQHQRDSALEEEKASWKANETKEIAEQAAQKEAFQKASAKTRQELIDAHPDWYGEDPADPDGNELLKLGREYLAYQPRTFDEAVKTFERNKLNAEALPRMADRLEKAKARIADLEAQVAEFKSSGPGTTRRSTQETGKPEEDLSIMEEMKRAVNG